MIGNLQFKTLATVPKTVRRAAGTMHPETKRVIDQIKKTRGKVLACTFKTARDAKNRLDALRRAHRRGTVTYKEARRSNNTLYLQLR